MDPRPPSSLVNLGEPRRRERGRETDFHCDFRSSHVFLRSRRRTERPSSATTDRQTAECHFAKPPEIGAMSTGGRASSVGAGRGRARGRMRGLRGGGLKQKRTLFPRCSPICSPSPSLPLPLSSVVSRSPFVPSDPIFIGSPAALWFPRRVVKSLTGPHCRTGSNVASASTPMNEHACDLLERGISLLSSPS